tara:strand:- start:3531 stop:5609 length:2079 start_codon:yes stop_codon:yes gene_type:complete
MPIRKTPGKRFNAKKLRSAGNLTRKSLKLTDLVQDQSQLEKKIEALNLTENVGYTSYTSRAVPSVDIPDPSDMKLEFVYNYYTPDERVKRQISSDEQIINLESSDEAQVLYQITNDRKPRYMRIDFKPAKFLKNSDDLDIADVSILDNLDKLFVEGATSSKYFSGTELVDTLADQSFYNLGELSEFILSTKNLDSPNSNAQELSKRIKSKDLKGDHKKLIMDVMSDLQPQGISYASSDTRREQVAAAYDSAARQSFSLKFNNMFFSDVITAGNRQVYSVFEDELRAYTTSPSIAEQIQEEGIKKVNPTKIFEDEYEFYGTPVSSVVVKPTNGVKSIDTRPRFAVTGYIIQRFEVLENGSLEILEPLIVENPEATYALDSNIRYGGTYIYKIRTVAIVEAVAKSIKRRRSGGNTIQYVRSKFLLASEGVSGTINCIESNPPPPPVNVRFRYDYEHRKPVVSWEFPINPTRDIVKFQVFKRMSVNEAFKLQVEYDFDQSVFKSSSLETGAGKRVVEMQYPVLNFVDKGFKDGDSPIYAIAAIDAHGMTSNYSEQFQVKYNKFKNTIDKTFISRGGAPKSYPNIYLEVDTFQDTMKSSGKDRMTVVFDPEYYTVTKKVERKNKEGKVVFSREYDLKLIGIDPENPTYKIQIINTDFQQSENVDIFIGDLTSPPLEVPASKLSKNNLSFEFGVKVD